MTTPYQKHIAFILLTGLLLQSCNVEIPVTDQGSEALNNTSEECEGEPVLSEIQPSSLNAPNQEGQTEDCQASTSLAPYSHSQIQRSIAPTSIAASSVMTRGVEPRIKIKRLLVKHGETPQGGCVNPNVLRTSTRDKSTKSTSAKETSKAERYISVDWEKKPSSTQSSSSDSIETSLDILTPSLPEMYSRTKLHDGSKGNKQVSFSIDSATEKYSPMFFEIKIRQKQLSGTQIGNIRPGHIVGLSTFKDSRYSLEVYTNSELPHTIPASDSSSVKTNLVNEISEDIIRDLKKEVQKEGKKVTQEQEVQTKDACNNRPKWLRNPLLLYGSVCGTAGLAVIWFLIKKPVG